MRVGKELEQGELPSHERKWVAFDIAASEATHDLDVEVDAHAAADGVVITYFVRGFFIHEAGDVGARQTFIEAVVLNQLDSLDAFGEDDGARPTR